MSENYMVVWEFEVRPTARAEFEGIYGADGDWAKLFRFSPEFRGTKLIHDIARPERYLTLDAWTSREALHSFKEQYAAEYAALDRRCESLTAHESLAGEFMIVL